MEHMQKLMTLQWKISNNIKAFYAEIKKKNRNITMKCILKVMSRQAHKIDSRDNIKLAKLKFRPIID